MPSVCRIGDMTEGHGYFATPVATGTGTVLVNGLGAAILGGQCVEHSMPQSTSHVPMLSVGSTTVLMEGKGAVRTGDPTECGDVLAAGSPDTICG